MASHSKRLRLHSAVACMAVLLLASLAVRAGLPPLFVPEVQGAEEARAWLQLYRREQEVRPCSQGAPAGIWCRHELRLGLSSPCPLSARVSNQLPSPRGPPHAAAAHRGNLVAGERCAAQLQCLAGRHRWPTAPGALPSGRQLGPGCRPQQASPGTASQQLGMPLVLPAPQPIFHVGMLGGEKIAVCLHKRRPLPLSSAQTQR